MLTIAASVRADKHTDTIAPVIFWGNTIEVPLENKASITLAYIVP